MLTTLKEGKIYDKEGPEVIPKIQAFIKTYEIDMNQVLIQNLSEYKTFNQFFSRKLKPTARPIDAPKDASVIVSAADCRLNVFQNFTQAREFWYVLFRFSTHALSSDTGLGSKERSLLSQNCSVQQTRRNYLEPILL